MLDATLALTGKVMTFVNGGEEPEHMSQMAYEIGALLSGDVLA